MAGPRNYTDKALWNPANVALNNINVPVLGQISAFFSNIGATSGPNYGSQDDLGKKVAVGLDAIANYTYTTNGTLYEGVYQLVQLDSAATAANVGVGKVAYWLITATGQYVVTDSAHATSTTMPAGIFLNSVTPGNYTAIFVGGGRVSALFTASLTTAGAIGNNVAVGGATAGTVDSLSGPTVAPTPQVIGNAVTAPAAATASVIFMSRILNRI
jgi:hypothetical protein